MSSGRGGGGGVGKRIRKKKTKKNFGFSRSSGQRLTDGRNFFVCLFLFLKFLSGIRNAKHSYFPDFALFI